MNKKDQINRIRDDALSMELPRHCGICRHMFVYENRFIAICDNSIQEIHTPDSIDPDREHIETNSATSEIINKGITHPIVARTFIQALQITKNVPLPNEIENDLKKFTFEIMQLIDNINYIIESINLELEKIDKEYIKHFKRNHKNNKTQSIPQVSNLEHRVKDFISGCYNVLKKILELIQLTSPEPASRKSFSWMIEYHRKKNNKLSDLLNHYEKFFEEIWGVRNSIEHPDSTTKIEIQNIAINPDNSLSPPYWKYSYRSWSKSIVNIEEKHLLIGDMLNWIKGLLSFTEDLLLFLIYYFIEEGIAIAPCGFRTIVSEGSYPRYRLEPVWQSQLNP